MDWVRDNTGLAAIVAGALTLAIVPFTGGLFLRLASRWLKRPRGFLRCWWAYFAAYLVASVVTAPILYFLLVKQRGIAGLAGVGVFLLAIAIHLLIVPRILRMTVRQSLPVQLIAYACNALVIAALIIWPVYMLHADLRDRAYRISQLQTIVRAMTDHGQGTHLPAAAIHDSQKRPLLSWRVAILPALGEEELFRQFKLDEPWDSPHNRALLPRMPRAYAPPPGSDAPAHSTYLRVFVATPQQWQRGPRTPFSPGDSRGMPMYSVSDGPVNTVLVVEAAEAVPWTKPQELEFDTTQPLPKLGGGGGKYCYASFVDGHVSAIPREPSPQDLTALITADGGDLIGDINY